MKPIRMITGIFTLVSITFSTGKAQDTTGVSATHVNVADKLDGWKSTGQGLQSFTANTLYSIINGGAEEYIDAGCIDGTIQFLIDTTEQSAKILVCNFGSEKKAVSFFKSKARADSDAQHLEQPFDQCTYVPSISSATVIYAHLEKLFIQITFSGSKNLEMKKKAAAHMLNILNRDKLSN